MAAAPTKIATFKFDGGDVLAYAAWRDNMASLMFSRKSGGKRLSAAVEFSGVQTPPEGDRPAEAGDAQVEYDAAAASAAEWAEMREANEEAFHLLRMSVSQSVLFEVPGYAGVNRQCDGRALWIAIQEHFLGDDIGVVEDLKERVQAVVFSDCGSAGEYLTHLEQLRGLMKQTGSKLAHTTEVFVEKAIRELPSEFHLVTQPIMLMGIRDEAIDHDANWVKLCKEVRVLERKLQRSKSTTGAAALQARADQPNPPRDPRRQHGKPQRPRDDGGRRFTGACWHCHERGHAKRDCPHYEADLAKAMEKMSRARERAQAADKRPTRPNHVHAAFLTGADGFDDDDRSFAVDSGATRHVCANRDLFVNTRKTRQSILLADGTTQVADAIGTVQIRVRNAEGDIAVLQLVDTLYVPSGKVNLLSVSRVERAGGGFNTHPHPMIHLTRDLELPLERQEGLYVLRVLGPDADVLDDVSDSEDDAPKDVYDHPPAVLGAATAAHGKGTIATLLHRRAGHLHAGAMVKAGLIKKASDLPPCENCPLGKQKRTAVKKKAAARSLKPGDKIHSDLNGPMEVKSLSGKRYIVSYCDHATRYVWAYYVTRKSEVLDTFKQLILDANQLGVAFGKGSVFHADNDVYAAQTFRNFCKSEGIRQTFSPPHTQAHNGVAERQWNTNVDTARTMLIDAGLPKPYWVAAYNHAVFTRNASPHSALAFKSPFELVHGRKFDLSQLHVFGDKAFVHVPRDRRKKWDPKAREGIYFGHHLDSNSHLVFIPATMRVVHTIHATIRDSVAGPAGDHDGVGEMAAPAPEAVPAAAVPDDADVAHDDLPPLELNSEEASEAGDDYDDLPALADSDSEDDEDDMPLADSDDSDGEDDDETEADQSHDPLLDSLDDGGAQPAHDAAGEADVSLDVLCRDDSFFDDEASGDDAQTYLIKALASKGSIPHPHDPVTYQDVLDSPNREDWLKAKAKEDQALSDNDTYTRVRRDTMPPGTKPLRSMYLYKSKRGDDGEVLRYKARLVLKGCAQRPGIDYDQVFAPVAHIETLRVGVAIAAQDGLPIDQMDAVSAFLQSELDEDTEAYMEMPKDDPDTTIGTDFVCKLNRPLYGMKQAPRCWYKTISDWMAANGYLRAASDPCLFIKKSESSGSSPTFVIVWVDDLVVIGDLHGLFKDLICKRFKMKCLGQIDKCLGMTFTVGEGVVSIDQSQYARKVLKLFSMDKCKPVATPLAPGTTLRKYESGEVGGDTLLSGELTTRYREIVGSLMYLVTCTRPDLAVAVSMAASVMSAPTESHMVAVKHILRYLAGNVDAALVYSRSSGESGNQLIAYADATWGSDHDTGRSRSGYACLLNGAAVSWKSKAQKAVALSTAEAEYVAFCEASREVMYLRSVLGEIGYAQRQPTVIYEDNQPCIQIATNPMTVTRTKHMAIKFHYVREVIAALSIEIKYCPTGDMIADLLTKVLPKEQAAKLCALLFGTDR